MKKNLSLFVFFIVFINSILTAQFVSVVPAGNPSGTGSLNTAHRKPLGSYYGFERSAMIYLSDEIDTSGTITMLSFYCDTINSSLAANTPVSIFLKETSDSLFTTGATVGTEQLNSTLVFSGTLTASQFVKNAFTTITLSNPFVYSGSGNLEVIIETNATGTGNEGPLSKGFRYSGTLGDSAYRFQYWQQDLSAPTGAGSLDYNRPNIQLTFTASAACSGVPTAGNAIASDSSVCSGKQFSLSLQGNTSDVGITYQWQSSPDAVTWTNMSGANSPFINTSITDTTFFQCLVSCGPNITNSTVIQVNLNAPIFCYCSTGLGGGCSGTSIESLGIAGTTFSNQNSGCANNTAPNYSVYQPNGNLTATLTAGQSYTVNATAGGDVKLSMWIDYNQDGHFGINEWEPICSTSVNGTQVTATINISPNAIDGLTGMRFRSRIPTSPNDSTNSCTSFASGETEDYWITITGGLAVGLSENKPEGGFSVFPNPSNGKIKIRNDDNPILELLVNDINGKTVHKEKIISGGNNEHEVDLTTLSTGIYFLRVHTAKNVIVRKLILN